MKMERKHVVPTCIAISLVMYICLDIVLYKDNPEQTSSHFLRDNYKYSAIPYDNLKKDDTPNLSDIPICNDPKLYYFSWDDTSNDVTETTEFTIFKTRAGYCTVNTPQRSTVFRNVCFNARRDSSEPALRAFMTSYDDRILERTYLFPVRSGTNSGNGQPVNYWQIKGHKASAQKVKEDKFSSSILVFSSSFANSGSLYQLHHETLPQIRLNLELSKKIDRESKSTHSKTLVFPTIGGKHTSMHHAFTYLGYDKLITYRNYTKTLCTKWAIFGFDSNMDMEVKIAGINSMTNTLIDNWPSPIQCDTYHVLFVERTGSRRIIDLPAVVEMFKSEGYKNIKVVNLEKYTFEQQFELVRCTAVLVGFQGDGLALFAYLPKHASVIEFVHPAYPSVWWQRIDETRPDLNKYAIECEAEIPVKVWINYAHLWLNHTGPVDMDVKLKLLRKSKQQWPTGLSMFKESNNYCAVTPFFNILPRLDGFRKHELETDVFVPTFNKP